MPGDKKKKRGTAVRDRWREQEHNISFRWLPGVVFVSSWVHGGPLSERSLTCSKLINKATRRFEFLPKSTATCPHTPHRTGCRRGTKTRARTEVPRDLSAAIPKMPPQQMVASRVHSSLPCCCPGSDGARNYSS